MITLDKIKIYNRFNGDIDAWARVGTKYEKSIIDDDDWYLIESFVQDISLAKKGLVSNTFINLVKEKLKENCDSEEVIQAIKEMA